MDKSKACPACGVMNWRVAAKCAGCGHVFFAMKGRGRKKKAAAAPDEPLDPSFSAGLSLDGELVMFWFVRGEFHKLTPEETNLVRPVLQPGASGLLASLDVPGVKIAGDGDG